MKSALFLHLTFLLKFMHSSHRVVSFVLMYLIICSFVIKKTQQQTHSSGKITLLRLGASYFAIHISLKVSVFQVEFIESPLATLHQKLQDWSKGPITWSMKQSL